MFDLRSQPLAEVVHADMGFLYDTIVSLQNNLDMENGPWVAGGSLRRLIDGSKIGPFDLDIFSNDPSTPQLLDKWFVTSIPVQITVKPHGKVFANVQELLMDFDFTVCMFATDGKSLVYHPSAMIDLCEKRLRTLGEKEVKYAPIKTFQRFLRYCLYGFVPDRSALATVDQEFPFFGSKYYSPHVVGKPNEQAIEDLTSRSFTDAIVLSHIGDIICENVDDRCYVFVEGIPLPVEYGFLFFYSEIHRMEILNAMEPIWEKLGIDHARKRLNRMIDVITPATLLRAIHDL